jgi:outer membrane protein
MKRTYIFIAMAFLLGTAISTQAQETWSLLKCIDYALQNNIQIKQQALNSNYYQNELNQAKQNRLPNLNAGLQNNMNYGRTLGSDNTYLNINSNSTSGNLSANVTLWNGFTLNNAIKRADLDLQASLADLDKAKNDIMLNIAAAYLEILYAQELQTVAEDVLKITQLQIDRTNKLVDAGSLARGSLFEIEAQAAREELDVVNAQNRVQLDYLALYQLLELPSTESFKIEKPVLPEIGANMSLMNSMEIFRSSVSRMPEVKSAEFKLGSSKKQLQIAKGNLYPTLSLGASYYNMYNNKYTYMTPPFGTMSFKDQINSNQRYGFGLSLNIPIFNRFQVRNGISNAQIQVENNELQLQNTKNLLRKDIEQAYTNALAAFKRYLANQKTVIASKEAFRYTEEKFNVGMVNSVEYDQSKNNLSKAQSDLLQAKYEYIFRTKILDFYNGKKIEL